MIAIGSFPWPGQTSKINLTQPSSQHHPWETITNPSVLATSLIQDYSLLSFFIVGAKPHTAIVKSKNRIPRGFIKIEIFTVEIIPCDPCIAFHVGKQWIIWKAINHEAIGRVSKAQFLLDIYLMSTLAEMSLSTYLQSHSPILPLRISHLNLYNNSNQP